jgi:hypothetical protein
MTPEDIAISNANYGHGFIECTLNPSNPRPSFNFILVSAPSAQAIQMTSLGGSRRKIRTKKYKKKKAGKGKSKKSMKKRTRKIIKRRRYKY